MRLRAAVTLVRLTGRSGGTLLILLRLRLHALESVAHLVFHRLAEALALNVSLLQPLLVQSGLILRMLKILPLLQVLGLFLTELSPQDLHLRVGLTLGLIQCLRQLALLLASLSCIRS